MKPEEKMYELLRRGAESDNQELRILPDSSDEETVDKLLRYKFLEVVTGDSEETIVALTPSGWDVLNRARQRGLEHIEFINQAREINQTFHGPTYNQTGDRNVMNVTVLPPSDLLRQIAEIRSLLGSFPEQDRDEAEGVVTLAETAAKKGNLERAMGYMPTLLGLANGAVDIVQKIKGMMGNG